MLIELLKAYIIGILAALPLGPVAVFIAQKTLSRGRFPGFIAGIGPMVIDSLYAALALLALGVAQDMLDRFQAQIMLVGGILILMIGVIIFRKKETAEQVQLRSRKTAVGFAFQAAGCALSNPGAFLLMVAYLSFAQLDAQSASSPLWLMVLLVAVGELSYWWCFTLAISKVNRFRPETLTTMNKFAGAILAVIGVAVAAGGLTMIL